MKVEASRFRDQLLDITKEEIPRHWPLLRDLNQENPHEIRDNPIEPESDVVLDDFNCFEYAFDLIRSSEYKAALDYQKGWKIRPVGADVNFVQYLLENSALTELTAVDNDVSCVIIYFNGVEPTHAGKFNNSRVRSKWGRGLLLEHNFDEVPSSYGDNVKFYESLLLDDCIDVFVDFAKANGIPYKD